MTKESFWDISSDLSFILNTIYFFYHVSVVCLGTAVYSQVSRCCSFFGASSGVSFLFKELYIDGRQCKRSLVENATPCTDAGFMLPKESADLMRSSLF